MGEQALSPPLSYQHLEYHINGKGIQQSHNIKKSICQTRNMMAVLGIIQQNTRGSKGPAFNRAVRIDLDSIDLTISGLFVHTLSLL
jgi:hypothetical protein